jgi:hypothetical protein
LYFYLIYILLTPIRIAESDVELNTLKAMVKKVVSFFYHKDPSSDAQTAQLLDGLLSQCREVILARMKQAASLTLGILVDVSYAASQAHRIINVALYREYSPGIVFIFFQGRNDLYHV